MPVREIEKLRIKKHELKNLAIEPGKETPAGIEAELMDISATIDCSKAAEVGPGRSRHGGDLRRRQADHRQDHLGREPLAGTGLQGRRRKADGTDGLGASLGLGVGDRRRLANGPAVPVNHPLVTRSRGLHPRPRGHVAATFEPSLWLLTPARIGGTLF